MIIEPRFNGPPGSANGGYLAGRIADLVTGDLPGQTAVQVTLRHPPPLATRLELRTSPAKATLYEAERLIAEAVPAPAADLTPPPPVGYADAVAAAAAYPGFVDHPFPTCYVCGPDRAEGDGLRIFPGPVPGRPGHTAAPWLVPAGVATETVWAALDCPGGWAILSAGRPYLLGRITAVVTAVPAPGSRCVAVGALIMTQGRKAEVRSALYAADPDPGSAPLGVARATWIAI